MSALLHPSHKQQPGLVASRGRIASDCYTDAHTRRMERFRQLMRPALVTPEVSRG